MDFLLKVGRDEHIQDMYDNEYLHFSTVESFRTKDEDNSGRNDSREALTSIKQFSRLKITLPTGKAIQLDEISKNFTTQLNESPEKALHNICSLYTLSFKGEDLKYEAVDSQVLALGSKTLIIYDLEGFFKILDNSLEQKGLEYSRKPVKYYDHKKHEGSLTLHHKDAKYSYQKEYRIIIKSLGEAPIRLSLRGLKKVSTVADTSLINTIELKYDD